LLPDDTVLQGSPVRPTSDESVIEAVTADAFERTELDDILQSRGIEQLVFVGLPFREAVAGSSRAALEYGYEVLIVEDATAGYDIVHSDGLVVEEWKRTGSKRRLSPHSGPLARNRGAVRKSGCLRSSWLTDHALVVRTLGYYARCTGGPITTRIVQKIDNIYPVERLDSVMGWSHTPAADEEKKTERESGTKWWYIAGVAIGAGTG
jgi:hypothetical protein